MNTNLVHELDQSFVFLLPDFIREYSCSFVADVLFLEIYRMTREIRLPNVMATP